MFERILIANRGEIACRIARTCARLGVESVAVYSRVDADALHVRSANRAQALRAQGIADGYLDGAAIIAAARACGAQAIHPGYGFLAENADFAQACEASGICFIGPDAGVIRTMGDKARAREIARAAGVPVVPGVEEPERAAPERDLALVRAASQLCAPLLIKACAGGGGRGMRRVDDAHDLAEAIVLARREAMASFGDDALIVERYIARPRHIEVQILADGHGRLLHLYERDCSIQRRYQKLIEEAPAPGLAVATRAALHDAALTLARAVGYRNAGTVEFILDADGQAFYFLEMNTRLQVEHPVTEAILGLDLVEWQIRIAAGEAIAFAQDEVQPRGWAIEARINAEDPACEFASATGTVLDFRAPAGEGVRMDSGIAKGDRVQAYYDSMLGKLIVHGDERAHAVARLAGALDATSLIGVRSNIAFLAALVRLPAFRDGASSTAFIAEQFPGGWHAATSRVELAMAAAWFATAIEHAPAGPWHELRGFRITAGAGHPARSRMLLGDGGEEPLAVWVWGTNATSCMAVTHLRAPPPQPDAGVAASGRLVGGELDLILDGRHIRLVARAEAGWLHLHGEAGWHAFRVQEPAELHRVAGAGLQSPAGPLAAPVPGVVASVEVSVGDTLQAGDVVLVIESMKMYRTVHAPMSARIEAIHCAAGDAVSAGQVLATLEALGEDEEEAARRGVDHRLVGGIDQ